MSKKIFLFLFFLLLSINPANSGDLYGMTQALKKAKSAGVSIDLEATSKEYGYKNFKGFVKAYSKEQKIKHLTVEDAKIYFLGFDRTVKLDESQEALDKLHALILKNKIFKRRTKYFKRNNADNLKYLAVSINYKKEIARINENPKLKKISPFTWSWSTFWFPHHAVNDCHKDMLKRNFVQSIDDAEKMGFICMIVDTSQGGEHLNLIKTEKERANCREKGIRDSYCDVAFFKSNSLNELKEKMKVRLISDEELNKLLSSQYQYPWILKDEKKSRSGLNEKQKGKEKKLAKKKEEKKLAKKKEEKKLAKKEEEKKLVKKKEEEKNQKIIETIAGKKVLDDDYVVLVNLSANAPHALYDLQENIVFDDKIATTCALNSGEIDPAHLIYIRYQINKTAELETLDFKGECIEDEYLTNDLIILQTKNLKKEKEAYLQKIAAQITKKNIKTLSIILDEDYQAAIKKRKSIIYQIKQDIKDGNIKGYGTLVLANNSNQFCLSVPKEQKKHLFLIDSLQEEFVLMGVQKHFSAIFFGNANEVFAKSQKEKCGFIYANEIDLKKLINGLTTAKIGYALVSKWFSEEDLKYAEQLEEQELLSEQLKRETQEREITEELERQKSSGELLAKYTKELRAKHENIVNGHKNYLKKEFNLFFFNNETSEFWDLYPDVISYFNDKKNKGWQPHKYSFEIYDFGTTTYKNRELPGFIMKLHTEIKNNMLGEYEENCIVLAALKDKEFSYYRNPGLFECGENSKINRWRKVNKFKTQWNPTVDDIK